MDLSIDEGPKRLVVEGRIALVAGDPTGRQVIRLTTTDAVAATGALPAATGATVVVTDGAGGTFPFVESSPGSYVRNGLIPVIGRTYTATIDYQGDRYQAVSELLPVSPIDSLYFRFEVEGIAQGDSGFRAVIDYADPPGSRNFYLWELLVDGEQRIGIDPGNSFRIISDDEFYDGGRVIGYQPYDEEIVEPGERVTMRQIALSEAAYRFYFEFFQQTTGGGPFSTPPASVRGNVANLTDRTRPALGWFLATQISERTAIVPAR